MSRLEISPGDRFGRLTVIEEAEQRGKIRMFLCRCDCGALQEFRRGNLRSGNTSSCGCRRREVVAKRQRTHDQRRHPLYAVWNSMLARCYNPNHKSYADYGGRGIEVCEKWHKFDGFFEDMSEGYQPGLTLERIENERGYKPGNCRWATYREQNRNRRDNRMIDTPRGQMLLCEAAEVSGIDYNTLWRRLNRGWPAEKLFTPPRQKGKKK